MAKRAAARARPAGSAPVAEAIVTPRRVFLILGVTCGLLFLVLTPPFQVPDEPFHFYRAFQVSELPLLVLATVGAAPARFRETGTLVPRSLRETVIANIAGTRFRPERKVSLAPILAGLRAPLDVERRGWAPVAPYPPPAYLPQALGVGLGRLLGAPPLVLLYLGRLAALSAWVALVALAIATTPILKWAFTLLALMPMTLYLAASQSLDSVVIGVAFLLTAELLAWAYDPAKTRVATGDAARLLVLAIVLALSKPPYLLTLALVILVPPERFGSRARRLLVPVVIVLACVAASALTTRLSAALTTTTPVEISAADLLIQRPPLADVSAPAQTAFIRAHPGAFLGVLVRSIATLHRFYLASFVGILGWLDTPLPPWVPYLYVAALLAACLLDTGGSVSWRARALAAAVFVLTLAGSLTALYISFSSVGMSVVYGYQGRYLIPVAPVLCLVAQRRGAPGRITRALGIAAIALVALTTSVTAYRLLQRFYLTTVVTFGIDEVSTASGRDVLFVKGWAVDRASGDPAAGVDVEIDGRPYPARYGLDRHDVASKMDRPAHRYSGFEAQIPIADAGGGRHTLALRVHTHAGITYTVPDPPVPLLLK